MRRARTPAVLLSMVALAACDAAIPPSSPSVAPEVHVVSATLAPDGRGGILTFAAHNAGAETDTLTAAACSCDGPGRIVGDAAIQSQETALFAADGPHVEFRRLDLPAAGSFVDVSLTFEHAGDVAVTAEVIT